MAGWVVAGWAVVGWAGSAAMVGRLGWRSRRAGHDGDVTGDAVGPADALLAGTAGLLAGAVNAIAGGGTLITFPALLTAGVPAVTANITSSVGLVTGYAGGALGYRRELAGQAGRLRALGPAALLGGLVGAVVLLATPSTSFRALVPYLMLLSCLLLAAQTRLAAVVARRRAGATAGAVPPAEPASVTWPTRVGIFAAGIYGSYFGAGLGVLLLGVLGILLSDDLQRTNALKTLLAFGVNAVGVAVFLVTAKVSWGYAAILIVASLAGGILGARVARQVKPSILRAAVITLGVSVAIVMLVRG